MNRAMRKAKLSAVVMFLSTVVSVGVVQAQSYSITEVMSGLVTPRGLALGPDGGLYVAEAGRGGTGPSIILGSGNEAFLGASSAVSRLLNGVQERVLDGLPSVAQSSGYEANGLQQIAFDSSGQAFGLFGLGGNPADRNTQLGTEGSVLGTIARLPLNGAGSLQAVADISGHELTANPDGTTVDSNPFGLALTSSGDFLVADAGANDFVRASTSGTISTVGVLPACRTLCFPTLVAPRFSRSRRLSRSAADDAYYIGQLTGFPFLPGAANVYRFDPATEELSTAYTGFTNIVDLTFDAEGNLYVLQISSNGLASPTGPGSGELIKITPTTGARTTIASEGLMFPGSVVVDADGTLYVSNLTNQPSGGQVLAISLVPEPSSVLLLMIGVAALVSRWRSLPDSGTPCV